MNWSSTILGNHRKQRRPFGGLFPSLDQWISLNRSPQNPVCHMFASQKKNAILFVSPGFQTHNSCMLNPMNLPWLTNLIIVNLRYLPKNMCFLPFIANDYSTNSFFLTKLDPVLKIQNWMVNT